MVMNERLDIRLTNKQMQLLKAERKQTGNSLNAIIRIALNEYFMKKEGG